ncbi:MAG: hypothetical protein KAT35_03305 [Candidatus Aenigmarchaeota archaeon]|nr:hypothetical protein [Candidatus Aenigmarchaeota archaeon]
MAGMAGLAKVISTAVGVVSTVQQVKQTKAAGREAERLGAANAAAAEAETAEEIRRAGEEQTRTEATARARAAASGVRDGSQGLVIREMVGEHAQQLSWMRTAGTERAEQERQKGVTAGKEARARAKTSAFQGTGSFLAAAPDIYSTGKTANWWS